MKLIKELTEEVEYVSEASENGKRNHYIVGRFITCEEKNKNGRMYRADYIRPEVERYVTEVVKGNRAFGELGHPANPSINLDRVSHIITEIKIDGKYCMGKAKLTETPMGQIARGLMESGGQLGVSTRGMGSLVERSGIMEVQKDFKLVTVDIVSDPSGPGCFVQGIMEGVDWVYDPVKGTWQEELLHAAKKSINKMSINEIEEKKLAIFENYLASLTVKPKF